MKNSILTLIAFTLFSLFGYSQSRSRRDINHLLRNIENFENNAPETPSINVNSEGKEFASNYDSQIESSYNYSYQPTINRASRRYWDYSYYNDFQPNYFWYDYRPFTYSTTCYSPNRWNYNLYNTNPWIGSTLFIANVLWPWSTIFNIPYSFGAYSSFGYNQGGWFRSDFYNPTWYARSYNPIGRYSTTRYYGRNYTSAARTNGRFINNSRTAAGTFNEIAATTPPQQVMGKHPQEINKMQKMTSKRIKNYQPNEKLINESVSNANKNIKADVFGHSAKKTISYNPKQINKMQKMASERIKNYQPNEKLVNKSVSNANKNIKADIFGYSAKKTISYNPKQINKMQKMASERIKNYQPSEKLVNKSVYRQAQNNTIKYNTKKYKIAYSSPSVKSEASYSYSNKPKRNKTNTWNYHNHKNYKSNNTGYNNVKSYNKTKNYNNSYNYQQARSSSSKSYNNVKSYSQPRNYNQVRSATKSYNNVRSYSQPRNYNQVRSATKNYNNVRSYSQPKNYNQVRSSSAK